MLEVLGDGTDGEDGDSCIHVIESLSGDHFLADIVQRLDSG